jgi:hypothetical protein
LIRLIFAAKLNREGVVQMESMVAMVHYHIHWSNSTFDWQVFSNLERARIEAERLVAPDETYTIDHFDDDCPLCEAIAARVRGAKNAGYSKDA